MKTGGQLKHYGVRGMKWGVRKDTKFIRLNSSAQGKNADKQKYKYLLLDTAKNREDAKKAMSGGGVTATEYKTTRSLNIASEKVGRKTVAKLLKDKKFQQSVEQYAKKHKGTKYEYFYNQQKSAVDRAIISIGGNKTLRDPYIQELQKRGYDAVSDIDMSLTTANRNRAILAFDVEDFVKKSLS